MKDEILYRGIRECDRISRDSQCTHTAVFCRTSLVLFLEACARTGSSNQRGIAGHAWGDASANPDHNTVELVAIVGARQIAAADGVLPGHPGHLVGSGVTIASKGGYRRVDLIEATPSELIKCRPVLQHGDPAQRTVNGRQSLRVYLAGRR